MQRRSWIVGAVIAALWGAPAAARTGNDTRAVGANATLRDSDVDYAGRWPFSGRSFSDRDPDWRAVYRASMRYEPEPGRDGPDAARTEGADRGRTAPDAAEPEPARR